MRRVLLLSAGFAMLGLGGVGILLPVLPTTPFVLCASGCFAAASPRLYRWLAGTRYFGEYIQNYRQKTGISTKARVTGLIFLWGMLLLSMLLVQKPVVIGILAVVGVAVSIHILTIRARPRQPGVPQTKTTRPKE